MRYFLALTLFCLISLPWPTASAGDDIYFESHIRPVLKARCWHCHGDEAELEGKLDLRLARLITQGGENGAAVVAGQPDASLLWKRVSSGEMPPNDKKLSRTELDLIRRWIEQGARTAKAEPAAPPPPGAVSDEERSHWAFQPVQNPPLPIVKNAATARTTVDLFLLSELEKHNLGFSPEATRATLIRRTSLDLLGLPPNPDDVAEFVADGAPDAYERLVDRLLASPHYGARWARHWLDIAGYADSDGYTERDPERKYAYKYRDYVIRSLNSDKGWDEFLVEQLAGDELLTPPLTNLNADQAEKLIATGFLRMGPDGTGEGGVDANGARNDVMAETLKIVSTSLLGLSIGCAQCHNHRFDPISQTDYYRFRAIFEPAYDVSNWRSPQGRLVSLWSDADRQRAADVDAEIKKINDERSADMEKIIQEILEKELAKLPEELREPARTARKTAEKERTPEQAKLLKEYPSILVSAGSAYLYDQKRVDEHQKKFNDQVAAAQAKKPPEDFVHCLTEIPGQAPVTKVFFRGDHKQPREAVEPSELPVLTASTSASAIPADDPAVPTTGRRLAYARRLVSGTHPLVGRVLVNRIWLNHFGRGLVATPADFGAQGDKPSHPQLLDWLASNWASTTRSNGEAPSPTTPSPAGSAVQPWRLKSLHRLLLTSTAYRQSSRRESQLDAVDPDNRLVGRMSVRRLEAETIRDSILAVSGALVDRPFGPPILVSPDDVGMVTVGKDSRDSAGRPTDGSRSLGGEEFRRTIFVQVRRSLPLSMLEMFDAPVPAPNCELRTASTVAPQSLLLLNNEFLLEQSARFAKQIRAQVGDDLNAQARRAWQIAVGGEPSETALQQATAFLVEQAQGFREQPAPTVEKGKAAPAASDPAERALANLCQALISSNRFLYVE